MASSVVKSVSWDAMPAEARQWMQLRLHRPVTSQAIHFGVNSSFVNVRFRSYFTMSAYFFAFALSPTASYDFDSIIAPSLVGTRSMLFFSSGIAAR